MAMSKKKRLSAAPKTVGELIDAEYNPRKMADDQHERLAASMVEFGDLSGIVFNRRTGRLIGSHQRRRHMPDDTPIHIDGSRKRKPNVQGTIATGHVIIDGERWSYREVDVSEVTERAMNLAANQHSGEWDFELLPDVLEFIEDDYDLAALGFDDKLLAEMGIGVTEPVEEDEVPEPPKNPRSKRGKVYKLGPHRLMCGDSTNEKDVAKLLDGVELGIVFADPPYGIGYAVKASASDANTIATGRKAMAGRRIEGDADPVEADALTRGALALVAHADAHFVCCSWQSIADVSAAMVDTGLTPKSCIVWDKGGPYQHLDRFAKGHEFILYSGPFGGQKTHGTDVWHIPREFRHDHPTPKPVGLVADAILSACVVDGVVYDPFAGSGSTLIAAEQTGRICYTMEIDPAYCDVIRDRYAAYIKGIA